MQVRLLTNTFIGPLFVAGGMYGDKCREDYDCDEDLNLVCPRNEQKCQCRRGYLWNQINKVCYRIKEFPYDNSMQLRASFSLESCKIPTYLLILWGRVLEKPTGSQLVRNSPHFMEPGSSLPRLPAPVLSQINLVHAPIPSFPFSIAYVVPKNQSRPEANVPFSSEG